jgi:hypothetical protein
LFHEYLRLRSEKRALDFYGMTEEERLWQEALQQVTSRFEDESHPERRWLEARACILDFDPK